MQGNRYCEVKPVAVRAEQPHFVDIKGHECS